MMSLICEFNKFLSWMEDSIRFYNKSQINAIYQLCFSDFINSSDIKTLLCKMVAGLWRVHGTACHLFEVIMLIYHNNVHFFH